MWLKTLKLENIRAHIKREFKLGAGMTALTGRNGVGKSTLLEALFFALTGKCATEGRTRPGLLSWGGVRKGLVTLDFEAGGVEYSLSRGVPESKDRLSWMEGGKRESITKMGDVSQKMGELMGGVDADILLLSSFMPQGGAMRMVFGTQSERQREYASLFRLAHLEKSRKTLQAALVEIEAVPDYSEDLRNLMLANLKLAVDCQTAAEELARMKALHATGEARRNDLRARGGHKTRTQVETLKKALSDRAASLSAALDHKVAELAAVPESVQADPELTKKAAAYDAAVKVVEYLGAARGRIEALVAGHGKRPPKVDDSGQAALQASIGALEAEIVKLEKWQKLGRCPTCGTEVAVDLAQLPVMKGRVVVDRKRLAELVKAIADTRRDALQWDVMESQLVNERAREEELSAEAARLSTMVDNFDPEAYAKWSEKVAEGARFAKERARIEGERQLIADNLAKASAELAALAGSTFVEDLTTADEVFMQEYDANTAGLQNLIAEEATLRSELAMTGKSIDSKSGWMGYRAVCEAQRARLEKARAILHVDKLPRALLQGYRETLASVVNRYLAKFNQPFLVKIDDSLETVCAFSDGNSGTASDVLSGGQRVLATVCFRLAVTELLAGWVSLLVFDEPTPHLDADNRAALGEAFKLVKAYLKSQKIQTIVATHEPELLAVADAEIKL